MAHALEARDLAGAVTAAPACVRVAPQPADVADLLRDDAYLHMSVDELTGAVMKATGGAPQPDKVRAVFSRLKDEAGV